MIKRNMTTVLLAMASLSACAVDVSKVDVSKVEKNIELKDGSTVHFFKDGKMAMEDKYGRVISMKPGQVMDTKDGKRIIMIGNEVVRLEPILHGDHRN